jgi:hypothetical protein
MVVTTLFQVYMNGGEVRTEIFYSSFSKEVAICAWFIRSEDFTMAKLPIKSHRIKQ